MRLIFFLMIAITTSGCGSPKYPDYMGADSAILSLGRGAASGVTGHNSYFYAFSDRYCKDPLGELANETVLSNGQKERTVQSRPLFLVAHSNYAVGLRTEYCKNAVGLQLRPKRRYEIRHHVEPGFCRVSVHDVTNGGSSSVEMTVANCSLQ
jgi:hypothetical protein